MFFAKFFNAVKNCSCVLQIKHGFLAYPPHLLPTSPRFAEMMLWRLSAWRVPPPVCASLPNPKQHQLGKKAKTITAGPIAGRSVIFFFFRRSTL